MPSPQSRRATRLASISAHAMKALLPLLLLLACAVSCLADPKANDPKSNPPAIDLTLVPGKPAIDDKLLAEMRDSVKLGASSSPTPTPASDSTAPSQPKPGINFTWIIATMIVWLVLRSIIRPRNKSR